MSRRSGRRQRTSDGLQTAALAVGVVALLLGPVLVLRPILGRHLRDHPHQILAWGVLPVILGTAAWLIFMAGYRLTVKVVNSGPVPTIERFKTGVNTGAIAGVLFALTFASITTMYSRRSRDLGDEFPALTDSTAYWGVIVVAVAWAWWLAAVVAPPWIRYVGHRAKPARVDAVLDLGGSNAVTLWHRPTLGLGGVLRVNVGRGNEFDLGPGQSIGLRASDGSMSVVVEGRHRSGTHAMAAHLTLQGGEGTVVELCDGVAPRVKVRRVPETAQFELAARQYVSRWGLIGLSGAASRGRPAHRLSHREGSHGLGRRPRLLLRASLVAGLIVAVAVGFALSHVVDTRGDGTAENDFNAFDWALGTVLLIVAVQLHTRKWQLSLQAWERPTDFLLAVAAGATLYFSNLLATIFTVILALSVLAWPALTKLNTRRVKVPAREMIVFWRRQPDAVVHWLEGSSASSRAGLGGIRISAAHPVKDVSVAVEGRESVRLSDSPVGVRAPAGPLRLVVGRGAALDVVEVAVVAGAIVDVEVGLLPVGLQLRSLAATVSVDVAEPAVGELRKVERPDFNKFF